MINDVMYKVKFVFYSFSVQKADGNLIVCIVGHLCLEFIFIFTIFRKTGACVESVMFLSHMQWNILNYLELLLTGNELEGK